MNKKIIVNFGDSIFDNWRGEPSISSYIASLNKNTVVYNAGFGGTRMSAHVKYWNALSMYRLADSIVDKDFSLQKGSLGLFDYEGLVPRFTERVETLMKIDFNEVDIITIEHGTNDYTAGKLLDDPQDSYNIDTYAGALRYSITKITKAYPRIKIFICSPTYRYWEENGKFIDGDEGFYNKNSNTLVDFVDTAKKVAYEYKVPFINLYHEAGINKHNINFFFEHPDGAHHIETGRLRIAEVISRYL
jgi:hypothetical protein